MLKLIFEKIFPLYLLIASGFILGQKKDYDLNYVSDIVFYLLSPILIFISFYRLNLNFAFCKLVFADIVYIFVSLCIFSFIFRSLDKKNYKAIALSLTFSNVAYLGLPLLFFIYGEKAFEIGVLNFLVISLLHFSVGIYFLSGKVRELFKIPFIYACLTAFLFKSLKVNISTSLQSFLDLTGRSSLPLMLITLGTKLSKINLSEIKLGLILSVFKIFFNFLTLIAISKIFALEGLVKKVFILQNILPSAILNYVFCEKYNKSPSLVSSIIFFSTLLSIFYIPLFVYFLKS